MANAEIALPPYIRMEDNLTWWTLGATIAVDSGAVPDAYRDLVRDYFDRD